MFCRNRVHAFVNGTGQRLEWNEVLGDRKLPAAEEKALMKQRCINCCTMVKEDQPHWVCRSCRRSFHSYCAAEDISRECIWCFRQSDRNPFTEPLVFNADARIHYVESWIKDRKNGRRLTAEDLEEMDAQGARELGLPDCRKKKRKADPDW